MIVVFPSNWSPDQIDYWGQLRGLKLRPRLTRGHNGTQFWFTQYAYLYQALFLNQNKIK